MTITDALIKAASEAKWSRTKIAYIAGVTEGSVHKWWRGAIPSGDKLMTLRQELPGFAALLDQAA